MVLCTDGYLPSRLTVQVYSPVWAQLHRFTAQLGGSMTCNIPDRLVALCCAVCGDSSGGEMVTCPECYHLLHVKCVGNHYNIELLKELNSE